MQSGQKPKGQVKIKWNPEFAYAIGLLVSDGCLSKDGLHIILSSKDKKQLFNFKKCLSLKSKIGKNFSGAGNLSYRVQFGDVLFYKFLQKIGLSPAKSKTISKVLIPKKYFFDYLRGYFDGDGNVWTGYAHKELKRPTPVIRVVFTSCSKAFLEAIREKTLKYFPENGVISKGNGNCYRLTYAIGGTLNLYKYMYNSRYPSLHLNRKKIVFEKYIKLRQKMGNLRLRA